MPDGIPLRVGALGGESARVSLSGVRWLCRDGEPCRSGQAIGFCNVMVSGPERDSRQAAAFHNEQQDLQLAFVARRAGRVHRNARLSPGGWHDRNMFFASDPDMVIGWIEPEAQAPASGDDGALELHFMTGRRVSEAAEDRSGMLTGWHDRSRAWRLGESGPTGGVLGLGICELENVIRGEQGAFLEILAEASGAAQAINVPDSPLVHSARVIIEQIRRTPADRLAVAADFARVMTDNPEIASPEDWIFAAMSVQALQRSPTEERYDLVTRTGLETTAPADAIVLSIGAEAPVRLRHRTSGYSFGCHNYRLARIGPAMRDWFQRYFEWVDYSIDDIRRDYLEMARLIRATDPDRRILVLNSMSTLGREDILFYDAHDAPLGRQLQSVRARELNAMLHDIASEADLAIVDADAIGAELGGAKAIPDGVHQNGEMQALLRQEIVSILRARRVSGFA